MMHLFDYKREAHSNMTVCGLVVGDEFITENNPADLESKIAEGICSTCSQLQFRRDEPENEVGLPDVEGMPVGRKQERYGD